MTLRDGILKQMFKHFGRPWMQSDPTMQNNFQLTRIKFDREVTKGFKGEWVYESVG